MAHPPQAPAKAPPDGPPQVRGISRPQRGQRHTGWSVSWGIARPVETSCVRIRLVVGYVRVPQRSQGGGSGGEDAASAMPGAYAKAG